MKTLDEVIACFEKACDLEKRCEGCDGCLSQENGCPNDGAESVPDALHYLRAFRDAKDTLEAEKDRYAEAVRNCEIAENKYIKSKITYDEKLSDYISLRDAWAMEQENPPLTWQELKQMEGKPVWVEMPNSEYWIIIDRFGLSKNDGTEYMETIQNRFWKENYGSWWKAYERETK